jgi:hypothetical protein
VIVFFTIWILASWFAFHKIRRVMRDNGYFDISHPLWFVLVVLALTSAPAMLVAWALGTHM